MSSFSNVDQKEILECFVGSLAACPAKASQLLKTVKKQVMSTNTTKALPAPKKIAVVSKPTLQAGKALKALKLPAPSTLTVSKGKTQAMTKAPVGPVAPVVLPILAKPQSSTTATLPRPNITKEVRLIYSDVAGNNNKVWYGCVHQNGDVYTEWGRVGKAMQTKSYPGAGHRKLDAKEREKLDKGYTVARVVSQIAGGTSKLVGNQNLQEIAIKQISRGEPVLTRLVTLLVKTNIHQITSHSQITYNDNTGLFQSPLGVVTADAIAEAYYELDAIEQALRTGQLKSRQSLTRVSQYLRLIPQDFGMRLDVDTMFPDAHAIQKQKNLLDSLEASYNAITAAKAAPVAGTTDKTLEDKVFEVNVKVCDNAEIERVRKLYKKTKQSIHRFVAAMDVKAVYDIEMPTQQSRFDSYGASLPNIWELWHGTKLANVLNILRIGLKIAPPRTAATAGALFGNGLYFSDQSSKSLNYATDYWHGGGKGGDKTFFMFLAQVAMGKFHVPRYGQSTIPSGSHSLFAKPGQSGIQNNEMIIKDERQFVIKKLVEFQ